jgi:uncharacterized protein (DUF433 family)
MIHVSTLLQYPHLMLDDDGNARIDGTRYKVIHLAGEHYHYGWSAEEILRQHPDLRPEQVYAALTYFYDHRDRLVGEMQDAAAASEREAAAQLISRSVLLRRRAARES